MPMDVAKSREVLEKHVPDLEMVFNVLLWAMESIVGSAEECDCTRALELIEPISRTLASMRSTLTKLEVERKITHEEYRLVVDTLNEAWSESMRKAIDRFKRCGCAFRRE